MRITVVTIFPEMFESFLGASLLGKAIESGLLAVDFVDPRAFAADKHNTVDDAPYGGGPGMVMKAEPLLAAIESVGGEPRRLLLAPAGAPLTQAKVAELAGREHLVLVCGRYEGVDERVVEVAIDEVVSVGDYVVSGGEVPAMIAIDAVARLVPGVLGEIASTEEESFAAGLLEYPHYTRPAEVRGLAVPEVLRGGNHEAIRKWRRTQSLRRTRERRVDLYARHRPSAEDRALDPDAAAAAERTYVALAHYPVFDRLGDVVTSSVTNLDIHDIARSATTFGIGGYLPVSPVEAQRQKIDGIVATWRRLAAEETADNRHQALASVETVATLEDAIDRVAAGHGGRRPLVVATSARDEAGAARSMNEAQLRAEIDSDSGPVLLVFGTGWGLAAPALALADRVLAPIAGLPEFNHLAVRSAVAIVLDRLFGRQ